MIIEAEKSQDLQLASRRPSRAESVVLGQVKGLSTRRASGARSSLNLQS